MVLLILDDHQSLRSSEETGRYIACPGSSGGSLTEAFSAEDTASDGHSGLIQTHSDPSTPLTPEHHENKMTMTVQ